MRALILALLCVFLVAVSAEQDERGLRKGKWNGNKFKKMSKYCKAESVACRRQDLCRTCINEAKMLAVAPEGIETCADLRELWFLQMQFNVAKGCDREIPGSPLADLIYCLWDVNAWEKKLPNLCKNQMWQENPVVPVAPGDLPAGLPDVPPPGEPVPPEPVV